VVADVRQRFQIKRLIFVGDRGMVSQKNLEELRAQGQGYLVGLKRRGNPQVDQWLQTLKEELWVDCAVGITAREKHSPPRTRVQEVATEDADQRVFVIDSEERRQYEQGKRQQSMQRTLQLLEKLKARVQAGKLKDPTSLGAAAQRALAAHHGHRYYSWRLTDGRFAFWEDEAKLATEKRLEGTYVIATSEEQFSQHEAVAGYKQLSEVERGFRSLKDVLTLRPIWHHSPNRVKAHIFVAALALLLERLLERWLKEAKVDLSAREALVAVQTIRQVVFEVAGRQRSGVTVGSEHARQVLRALGIKDLRPPQPPKGQERVM